MFTFLIFVSHLGLFYFTHSVLLSMFLFSLSAQTEKGSALHEAALFGKTDVVQKLLSAGQTSVAHKHISALNQQAF